MKKYFILFIVVIVIGFTLFITCNTAKHTGMEASLPDLNNKPDGSYRGNYDLSGTPVKVTLDVVIQNNKIAEINIIKHICSPIGKKAEKITGRIIEKQSLNVDAVSGATGSSKAIVKAVENALQ